MKNFDANSRHRAVSLKDIKVAIFDFDNTLAIHQNRNYIEDRKADKDAYYIKAYENPNTFYETIDPCKENADMKNLVAYCRKEDIPMFCVTGMLFSIHLAAKTAFVENHYGYDIEVISAGGQERKPDIVRMLMKHFDVRPEQVLFVDDTKLNPDMGIVVIHPDEVKKLRTKRGDTLEVYMESQKV